MNIIFNFLEGNVSFDEFWKAWTADQALRNWLDNLVDLKQELPEEWLADKNYCGIRLVIHRHYGGSASAFINSSPYPDKHVPKCLSISAKYDTLAAVVLLAYPELKTTAKYKEQEDYYFSVVSDYFDGEEVIPIIERTLLSIPNNIGKTKRIKAAKKALKDAFHVEGMAYPRWVQEPEWPMGKNSPMKFERQEKLGELVRFYFVDVDTGEHRVIEQLY